jgi:hypothetical protein
MYSNLAEDEDKMMTERWQKDADGIIIFVHPGFTLFTVAC